MGCEEVRVGDPGPESGHEVRVEDSAFVDPTQVDSHVEVSQESGSAAVPSEGRASFGRVASVVTQDFERLRPERFRLVKCSTIRAGGKRWSQVLQTARLVHLSRSSNRTWCWQIRTVSVSRLIDRACFFCPRESRTPG